MTLEEQLVLSLTTTAVTSVKLADAVQRASIDWAEVIKLAVKWEIEPVVLKNLLELFSETMPAAVATVARAELQQAQLYCLSRTFVAIDLQNAFDRKSIRMIVLKGPAVGVVAYGDPALRPFGDLDLFVARSDLIGAKEALAGPGFLPDYPVATEDDLIHEGTALGFSNGHVKIELHLSLFSEKWRCDLDPELLLEKSRLVDCLDQHLRALAPDHLFVYLCAHGTRHGWYSPRWIGDIAQLARTYDAADAARVLAYAERTHTRRIVALGLAVARDVLEVGIGPFSAEDFARHSDIDGLVALVRQRLTSGEDPPAVPVDRVAALHPGLFWIRSRERRSDQIACFAKFLISRTAADVVPGPRGLVARQLRLGRIALRRLRLPAD